MKSLSASLRRRGGFILVVACAALVIYWYGRRNRPERLGPIYTIISEWSPPEAHYELSENPRTHTLNLSYQKAMGYSFQTVASAPLPPGLHFDPMSTHLLRVNRDHVYFTLIKEAALQRPPTGYGRVTGGGIYIPPVKPIIRHVVYQPSKEEIHVCSLPLTGGVIEDLMTGKGVTNIGITDDTIYWIDPRPEPTTTIEGKGGMSVISTPTSLLMATSLKTRQSRQIADKIFQNVEFVPDHSAIYWRIYDNGPGHIARTQLWNFAPDLAGPVCLTDSFMSGGGDNRYNQVFGDKPIALGDRLYWIEDRVENMPPPKGVNTNPVGINSRVGEIRVVSVRHDGTQRRMILTLPVIADSPSFTIFAADRGRLYLGLTEDERRSAKTQSTTYICRLNPNARQPLIKLLRLPDSAVVMRCYKGYVYYAVTVEHHGFFGDERVISTEYYRWKLPD